VNRSALYVYNGTAHQYSGRDFAWSFGDTMLSVYSNDRKVTHFFPYATALRITVTHE
jgi:hypothetical protein